MTARGPHRDVDVRRVFEIIGDRWNVMILRELTSGPRRFAELIASLPPISRWLLSDYLRSLEARGLIAHDEPTQSAALYGYGLTAAGAELMTAMTPLVTWGAKRSRLSRAETTRTAIRRSSQVLG